MTKIDIYSGFLGAGKTTLIKKMIQEAYKGEKLVLIENEFGEIGIDGGFLQDAGINITEMNSGCICCSLVGDFGKALTQVIGFLMFENGITLFGTAVMREHPVIVELGILLDVLALVFIMGITVYQIRREFDHIDSDKLNLLDDLSENMEAEK